MMTNTDSECCEGETVFELYVAGDNVNSRRAMANLKEVVRCLEPKARITVVDVLKDPKIAFTRRIFATPSLIHVVGGRETLIIGDLSDLDGVIQRLSA